MKPDGSVKVTGPVMARADRMAVNAKTQVGELRVMIVNGNAEAVPIAALNTATTIAAGKFALDAQQSNNATEVATGAQALEAKKSADATKVLINGQNTSIVPKP